MSNRFRLRSRHVRVAPRFFAAVLMLLIVLPFTAPFASCDFASLIGENAAQAGSTDVKTMKEETTPAFVATAVVDLVHGTTVCSVTIAAASDIRPLPLDVLRV